MTAPTETVAEVAGIVEAIARRPDLPADVPERLDEAAATLRIVMERLEVEDERAGRHARIVALARYAVDGNERDLLRLLTSEQVRR